MKFSHKDHREMDERDVMILAKKKLLVFNELPNLLSKLVENWFISRYVPNCQLHATDVCRCHGNIIHGVDFPNPFNVGGSSYDGFQ